MDLFAENQENVARSLVFLNAEWPEGFDPEAWGFVANSLIAKRWQEIQNIAPEIGKIPTARELFNSYAIAHPIPMTKGKHRADIIAFCRWAKGKSEAGDAIWRLGYQRWEMKS